MRLWQRLLGACTMRTLRPLHPGCQFQGHNAVRIRGWHSSMSSKVFCGNASERPSRIPVRPATLANMEATTRNRLSRRYGRSRWVRIKLLERSRIPFKKVVAVPRRPRRMIRQRTSPRLQNDSFIANISWGTASLSLSKSRRFLSLPLRAPRQDSDLFL